MSLWDLGLRSSGFTVYGDPKPDTTFFVAFGSALFRKDENAFFACLLSNPKP